MACRAIGVLCLFLAHVFAANAALADATAIAFANDHWTSESGLPIESIDQLSAGRDGFLYLATEAGLIRFDGARFDVLDESRIKGLRPAGVLDVFQDAKQRIWLASVDAGIQVISAGVSKRIVPVGFPEEYSALCLFHAPDGSIWAGTSRGLVHVVAVDEDYSVEVIESTRGLWISFVGMDEHGQIYFRDRAKDQMLRLDDSKRIAEGPWSRTPSGSPVRTFWRFSDGRTLFYSVEGLHWLGESAIGVALSFTGGSVPLVFDADLDSHGNVWIGTASNGVLIIRKTATTTVSAFHSEMDYSQVSAVNATPSGEIWFSTLGNGLFRLRETPIASYGASSGLRGDTTYTVAGKSPAEIVVGTNVGLYRLDSGLNKFSEVASFSGSTVSALSTTDDEGTLVGGRFNRIDRYGHANESIPIESVSKEPLLALAIARCGSRILVGTNRGLYEATNDAARLVPGSISPEVFVPLSIVCEGDSAWIGGSAGLRYYKDGVLELPPRTLDLPKAMVLSMLMDPIENRLLVGFANNGLALVGRADSHLLDVRDGMPSNAVSAIQRDENGYYWLGTNSGLYRIAGSDLVKGRYSASDVMPYLRFGKRDGLPSDDLRFQTAQVRRDSSDSHLYFVTPRGLAIVDSGRIFPSKTPIRPIIDVVRVDGVRASSNTSITLPSDSARVEVKYAIPALSDRQSVQVQYRLSSISDSWITHDGMSPIQFTNLGPGNHVLQIRARASHDVWGSAAAELKLDVPVRFVKTGLFKFLIGTGILVLLSAVYSIRLRFFRIRNEILEEKMRLASEFHDGLSQHFAAISLLLESVRPDAPDTSTTQQQIALAKSFSHQGMDELRRAVYSLTRATDEPVLLDVLVESICHQAEQRRGVEARRLYRGDPFLLDPQRAHNLTRILEETISNAITHAQATSFSIDVHAQSDRADIHVANDGVPSPIANARPKGARYGFGLRSVARRAARIGATIEYGLSDANTRTVLITLSRLDVPWWRLLFSRKTRRD
jgi:signal transduction histidine kinase/ligand-binding sensor domain-containing protein